MINLDGFFEKDDDRRCSGKISPSSLKNVTGNGSGSDSEGENGICSTYNFNQEFQYVIEQSKNLQKAEHIEIFKIIDNNGDDYTCNENGVFIALNKLKPETLNKIKQFIEFSLDSKSQLQKDLVHRDTIREIMNCQVDEIRGFNKIFLLPEKN